MIWFLYGETTPGDFPIEQDLVEVEYEIFTTYP